MGPQISRILAGKELVAQNAKQVTFCSCLCFVGNVEFCVYSIVTTHFAIRSLVLFIDPSTESRPEMINLDIYVPPDERFSPKKLSEFIGNSIRATVHFLIPEAKSLLNQDSSFQSFDEIRSLFSSNRSQKVEGWLTQKLQKLVPEQLFKRITHASKGDPMTFPEPQIIASNATLNLLFLSIFLCFPSFNILNDRYWYFTINPYIVLLKCLLSFR